MSTTTGTTPQADRLKRVQAICDGALARQHLGQAVRHRMLPDGRHEVILRGVVSVGTTLDEVIRQSQEAKQ